MKFLPDTNAWIDRLNEPRSKVAMRMLAENPRYVGMCTVVLGELYFGAYNSLRVDENLQAINSLAGDHPSVQLDKAAARHYGRICAELKKRGTPIGSNDLLIAAIALAKDLTVVTNNVREFSRVGGLKIEDWSI